MRHFLSVRGLFCFVISFLLSISAIAAQDAEKLLQGIPEEGQPRYDALQQRAVTAQQESRFVDALFLYEQLQELAEESGEIRYNRGTLYLELEEYERAIALFAQAAEFGFDESALYYNRGNAHFYRREYETAAEEYRKAHDRAPGDADVLNNLGLAELRSGNLEAAEESFLRAGATDDSFPEPFFHLALVYEKMGESSIDREENLLMAEEALTEAIRRDDTFVEAYYNRAVLLYTRKEFRAALDDFLKAHQLNPADRDILHNLGLSALAVANDGQ